MVTCMVVDQVDGAEEFDPVLMIAHAGGGYKGQNYTNSIEALNKSYQAGFRHMEIDFSWTSDGQLVCLHDWGKTFKKLFGFRVKTALKHQAFIEISRQHSDFQVCDLQLLAHWIEDKPEVKIITDIKYNNIKGIRQIIDKHPKLKEQLIPQFYQPEEYGILKGLGFDDLIWILYQYKGSKKSVVKLSQDMDLLSISMRAAQAKGRAYQKILKHHQIFVYTINDDKEKSKLINKFHVSGIYTDFLAFQ